MTEPKYERKLAGKKVRCCGGGSRPAAHGHSVHRSTRNVPTRPRHVECRSIPCDIKPPVRAPANLSFCSAGWPDQICPPIPSLFSKQPKADVPDGTVYTCPNAPSPSVVPPKLPNRIDLRALRWTQVGARSPPEPGTADMTRRFCVGLALSVTAVVLEVSHLVGWAWPDRSTRRLDFNWPSPRLSFSGPAGVLLARLASLLDAHLNMFR